MSQLNFSKKLLSFQKNQGQPLMVCSVGRATWKDAVATFAKEGEEAAKAWLADQGRRNVEELNDVLVTKASSWTEKVEVN